ncbi:unnamed protein product [Aphanomyces euteiches]|uniref:Uncharacterized protein n=1 Tax=Aphanomyces euteiches TaxID=100861 RepID=A0A6G0WMU8_9STRA|nr:hypothetical protein Ae201684_013635 [Aphanomyces euteiches]KAH9094030.1 hypothetical protein Ae201684P_016647 [Aphanomyces euteiches]
MSLDGSSVWTGRGGSRVLGAKTCIGRPGHVLLTTSDQVVLLNTSKLSAATLHSWEFRADSNQALSVPAVKDPNHDVFYGIRGKAKTELIRWSTATERLSALKGEKLPHGATAHLLVDSNLSGCIAVGSTGAVTVASDSVYSVLKGQAGATAIWSHLSSDATQQLHLIVVLSIDGHYDILTMTLAQEHDKALLAVTSSSRREVQPPSVSSRLTTCVFQEPSTLSLFWSCGAWQAVDTRLQSDVRSVASLTVQPEAKRRKLDDAGSSTVRPFAAAALSSKSLVVASSTSLQVWNSQYAVEMASRTLEDSSAGKFLDVLALPRSGASTVALVFEQAVQVAAIDVAASTLASVLGKGNSSTPSLALSTFLPSNPVEASVVVNQLELQTWQSTLMGGNDEQLTVLNALTTPSETPTREKFAKTFYNYIYFKSKKKIRAVLSPQFVVQVASRCVTSPELLLWPELSILIRSNHLCSRSIPSLVPTIMAHKQYGVLHECLVHLADVDEALSIRICKFVLRQASPVAVEAFRTQHAEAAAKVTTPAEFVEHFLRLVVALPRADVFLQNAMQALKASEVMALLACLKKWYTNDAADTHIVEWIGLLIDVHYTTLVLESDEQTYIPSTLRQLQTLVAKHVDACQHMADVHGELDQFLSSNLPKTGALPDYSVESLLL